MATKPPKLPAIPTRLRGTGTIRYLANRDCYLAELANGRTAQGNARRISETFPLRKYSNPFQALQAASKWLDERYLEKDKGTLLEPSTMTVNELVERYLAVSIWKPKHLSDVTDYLERFVKPLLGHHQLQELKPLHIEDWITGLEQGLKTTVKGNPKVIKATPYQRWKAFRYFKYCLNYAVDREIIERNPTRKIKVAKPPTALSVVWDKAEVWKVLEHLKATDPEMYRYVWLGLTTGLRREEMLGLTWPRVHLTPPPNAPEGWAPHLYIKEVVTYSKGTWSFDATPKTAKSERVVYLDSETVAILHQQHAHVALMRDLAQKKAISRKLPESDRLKVGERRGSSWADMNLVFPSRDGTPYGEGRLAKKFRDFCAAAGVTPIPPKNLRNTNATHTDSSGMVPIHVAAKRAGHSKDVREQHYQGRLQSQEQAAALPMASVYGPPPSEAQNG